MKSGDLLDAAAAEALEFGWLREQIAPAGAYGRRVFGALRAFVPGDEARAAQAAERIVRAAATLEPERIDALARRLRATPDVTPAIARAAAGDVLDDPDFLELLRLCDAVRETDALLAVFPDALRCGGPALDALAVALEPGRRGGHGFYLDDAFDRALAQAREADARAQAAFETARGRLYERVARALGREAITDEQFIVMRADLPNGLPPGVRIVREAPTYLVCEIELDEDALAALERREAAREALAHVEETVRARLSAIVRDGAADLERTCSALGGADVFLAQVRFAQRYGCTAPEIVEDACVAFDGGRFLPLEERLRDAGRTYVPISLDLHGTAVVTGPNMGGKSACLRTCGMIALCAAFGLPVPARRARVGLFDTIAWLGIGTAAGGDDEGLLSSFAREVIHLRAALQRPTRRPLLLLDEFARTTGPSEGKALLVAVLAEVRRRGACALAATHLDGVAEAAGAAHFVVRGLREVPRGINAGDLRGALEALARAMDYSVLPAAGTDAATSDALALAELLGLDGSVVAAARAALYAERRAAEKAAPPVE